VETHAVHSLSDRKTGPGFPNSAHSYLNISAPYSLYFGAHAISGVHVLHRSVATRLKDKPCEPIQATRSMHGRVRVSTEADDGNFEH